MMPLFNTFFIDLGTGSNQRPGSAIYIHRIECAYTIVEDPVNNVGPDEILANTNGDATEKCLTDPRFRVMVVTPK